MYKLGGNSQREFGKKAFRYITPTNTNHYIYCIFFQKCSNILITFFLVISDSLKFHWYFLDLILIRRGGGKWPSLISQEPKVGLTSNQAVDFSLSVVLMSNRAFHTDFDMGGYQSPPKWGVLTGGTRGLMPWVYENKFTNSDHQKISLSKGLNKMTNSDHKRTLPGPKLLLFITQPKWKKKSFWTRGRIRTIKGLWQALFVQWSPQKSLFFITQQIGNESKC